METRKIRTAVIQNAKWKSQARIAGTVNSMKERSAMRATHAKETEFVILAGALMCRLRNAETESATKMKNPYFALIRAQIRIQVPGNSDAIRFAERIVRQ